jgi:hypothetical protein
MSNTNGGIHFFHADATALGAVIEQPSVADFPVQSPLSLPPVGGHATAHSSHFQFERIASASSTYSEVEGSVEADGPRTTAISVVKRLNVLDRVKVREAVGHIRAEHPLYGGVPRVSFGETRFSHLQIGDSVVEVILDTDILGEENGSGFPEQAHLRQRNLWGKVGQQYDDKAGLLQCSLVKQFKAIKGGLPKIVGPNKNGFEIEDFGRVFLAELLVQYHSYQLIMMRFQFGSPTKGKMSAACCKVNGSGGGG